MASGLCPAVVRNPAVAKTSLTVNGTPCRGPQLWPFATLGWPDDTEDLNFFYPTGLLVTDRGIIALWVARMIMMGEHLLKKEPYSDVYIHGTILDKIGRRMSKSLGNGIDPLVMIAGGTDIDGRTWEGFGADAVRFTPGFPGRPTSMDQHDAQAKRDLRQFVAFD